MTNEQLYQNLVNQLIIGRTIDNGHQQITYYQIGTVKFAVKHTVMTPVKAVYHQINEMVDNYALIDSILSPAVARTQNYQAYCDGSCRSNPGPMAWVSLLICDGVILAQHQGQHIHGTNIEAEINAVEQVIIKIPADAKHITITTDCKWVVDAIYKVILPTTFQDRIVRLCGWIAELNANHCAVTVKHAPRNSNMYLIHCDTQAKELSARVRDGNITEIEQWTTQ